MPGMCVDCSSATHRAGNFGPHPKRCPGCADVSRRTRQRQSAAAYRERNPGRDKDSYARWYAANAEAKRAQSLAWYRENQSQGQATNARWYRENVESSRAKARRRRAITRGVHSEKFTAREIYERDGWICQLCREGVDTELVHPHPRSASLDHRVPLAAKGPHTRANVQLAHLDCNIAKGARH